VSVLSISKVTREIRERTKQRWEANGTASAHGLLHEQFMGRFGLKRIALQVSINRQVRIRALRTGLGFALTGHDLTQSDVADHERR